MNTGGTTRHPCDGAPAPGGFRFVAKDVRRSESGKARYAYRRQSAFEIRQIIISRLAGRYGSFAIAGTTTLLGRGFLNLELGEAGHGLFPKGGGIAGNRRLARLLDAGQPPIERVNQFPELAHELGLTYRHELAPLRELSRRDMFHTSPHAAHRQ